MGLSIKQLKYLRSLRLKKFRQKYDIFIAEGDKIAQDLLNSELTILSIYASHNWIKNHNHIQKNHNIKYYEINEKDLQKISSLKTPPEVLMLVKNPVLNVKENIFKAGHHIYLDGIQDPGNMGTIIRIADWFGFTSITKSPDSVDFFNSKVVQSSMGSIARIQLMVASWEELEKNSKLPRKIYSTSASGDNIFNIPFPENTMVILGNESRGLRPETMNIGHQVVSIPRAPGRITDSLNVAVAAGIICAQIACHDQGFRE